MTYLCVSKLTSIASDNGLSPGRRPAIIWRNAGILLIGPLGTNFSEILIELQAFSLKKIRLKMSSAKCRPFCLGLNVFTCIPTVTTAVMNEYGHTRDLKSGEKTDNTNNGLHQLLTVFFSNCVGVAYLQDTHRSSWGDINIGDNFRANNYKSRKSKKSYSYHKTFYHGGNVWGPLQ